jgi:hypothetical protein
MDVTVNAVLLCAIRLAAEVDPTVDAVDLEIERLAVRLHLLAVSAPAVEETVRSACDPLVVAHEIQDKALQ